MKRKKAVLVTGGAGFIGSYLCDRLVAEGSKVICLDNLQTGRVQNVRHLMEQGCLELIEHDVIDPFPDWLGSVGFTHIYHLACAASPPRYQADPEHTLLTNVVGTRNAHRLAERVGARLLLASTSEVYGEPTVHPQFEEYRGSVNCTGPRACYDEGKRAAETLAFDFHRSGRCETRVARLFNTYGPRMSADDGRVISNFLCQALEGQPITIYGDGSQTRSFCYVYDIVEGLMRLMNCAAAAGLPVNLGNPEEITINDLVARIVKMTGTPSRIVRRPVPIDDPTRRRPDISRAIELLDWRPTVELDEGLEASIAWFSEGEWPIAVQGQSGMPLDMAAE